MLLSDRLWRRRFGADPSIIGRQVVLDGDGYEVIGVMPSTLEHRLMPAADAWRALQYDRALPSFQGREWGHHLRMSARLREGVLPADAEADLRQIAGDPVSRFTRPAWASMPQGVTVEPLLFALTSETRPAMLTETLVLTSAGGIAGLLVAPMTLRALILLGPRDLTRVAGLAIDAPVFWIAFAVTAVVGLLVALLPAWSNGDLKAVLLQGSWQASSHHVMRRSLVVAEVAFALVLLAGASLLFRSLQQLFAVAPGFDDRGLLTLEVQIAGPRYRDPMRQGLRLSIAGIAIRRRHRGPGEPGTDDVAV